MDTLVKPALQSHDSVEQSHRSALIIVTILFFMWGLLTSLNGYVETLDQSHR